MKGYSFSFPVSIACFYKYAVILKGKNLVIEKIDLYELRLYHKSVGIGHVTPKDVVGMESLGGWVRDGYQVHGAGLHHRDPGTLD